MAPKKPNSSEMYSFCLFHVRAYNKRWNYFAGMSQDEIYKFQSQDALSLKPTKPISENVSAKIKFSYDFGSEEIFSSSSDEKTNIDIYNDELHDALDIFNLDPPFSGEKLKKHYNLLVKENHPDINGDNPEKEKLLKKINNYYKILKKIAK